MSAIHTLVITHSGNDADGWEADYTIECPGVTNACRSWQPCPRPEADHDSNRAAGIHHGEQHVWNEGRQAALDRCHLANDSDTLADAFEELAVKHKLSPGRYQVWHHFDDGQIDTLTLASEVTA
jgi:hypothetical protein